MQRKSRDLKKYNRQGMKKRKLKHFKNETKQEGKPAVTFKSRNTGTQVKRNERNKRDKN